MKKHLMKLLWVILLAESMYLTYKTGLTLTNEYSMDIFKPLIKIGLCIYVFGMSFSALIYEFICSSKTNSLDAYKRELEKESIDNTESSSRIKVLESKIEVLEKALENALKK